MVVVTAFPLPVFSAKKDAHGRFSIVVVPLIDGESDKESKNVAQEIAQALKFADEIHVIDTELAARVIEYSNNTVASQNLAIGHASDSLAKAKEKYFQFRYEDAEKELSQSISSLESLSKTDASAGALLVDALVSRAVIAKSRGNEKEMRQSLAAALKNNPKLDLKSEEYPPSIVSVLEEERAAMKLGPVGEVFVSSTPAAAEVYINGSLAGVTPIELKDIPAGGLNLAIKANKYETIEKNIQVHAGGRIKISERLKWAGAFPSNEAQISRDAAAEVHEGLRVAGAMKAEKAIIIDVDQEKKGEEIKVRMVDAKLRAGHRQIILKRNNEEAGSMTGLSDVSRLLANEAAIDLTDDPARYIDPLGIAKPLLLDKRKRHFKKSPVFWGVLGAIAAGALGGGLAAAFAGGGSGDGLGNVKVNFR